MMNSKFPEDTELVKTASVLKFRATVRMISINLRNSLKIGGVVQ